MKKIAVIASTRAEFGLLMPVIQFLREYEDKEFRVDLLVTGTHLSESYGYTIEEIRKHNIRIDFEIKIPVESTCALDISNNQTKALVSFTELFERESYDGVVILGDRYEMLAIVIAAGNTCIPIFHLCGGDTTEGAMDEWIRHSITKMSYLHFPTNEDSYKRILQLGESPDRVFNYGSTGIDNIRNSIDMDKCEALKSLGLEDCRYAICTYHPVTMERGCVDDQIRDFVGVIKEYLDIEFIVTKSNADKDGAHINELLDEAEKHVANLHVYPSLGFVRYLSLMKHAEFVMGNSSSGITETPSFQIPTVNIGDRQKGRLRTGNIIDCKPDKESIQRAVDKALSAEFRESCRKVVSPYGDGCAGEMIAGKIVETVLSGGLERKKRFYDLEVGQ